MSPNSGMMRTSWPLLHVPRLLLKEQGSIRDCPPRRTHTAIYRRDYSDSSWSTTRPTFLKTIKVRVIDTLANIRYGSGNCSYLAYLKSRVTDASCGYMTSPVDKERPSLVNTSPLVEAEPSWKMGLLKTWHLHSKAKGQLSLITRVMWKKECTINYSKI